MFNSFGHSIYYKWLTICITVEPESPDEVNFEEVFKSYQNITEAFVFLVTKMKDIISTRTKSTSQLSNLKLSCISQVNTPNGAQLSPELKTAINNTKSLDALFGVLCDCPYWSWLDIRLIRAMATASDSVKATKLVKGYEDTIFKRKLSEVLPTTPINRTMSPSSYYTSVVSKVELNLDDAIEKLLIHRIQLEKVIMDINNGSCAFQQVENDCIKVHWYIPSELAEHAYKSAVSKMDQFLSIGLQFIIIGEHPKISTETDSRTPENQMSPGTHCIAIV